MHPLHHLRSRQARVLVSPESEDSRFQERSIKFAVLEDERLLDVAVLEEERSDSERLEVGDAEPSAAEGPEGDVPRRRCIENVSEERFKVRSRDYIADVVQRREQGVVDVEDEQAALAGRAGKELVRLGNRGKVGLTRGVSHVSGRRGDGGRGVEATRDAFAWWRGRRPLIESGWRLRLIRLILKRYTPTTMTYGWGVVVGVHGGAESLRATSAKVVYAVLDLLLLPPLLVAKPPKVTMVDSSVIGDGERARCSGRRRRATALADQASLPRTQDLILRVGV